MTIIVTASFIFGVLLSLFVLTPLGHKKAKKLLKKSERQNENLEFLLKRKEEIFQKQIYGFSSNEEINLLSQNHLDKLTLDVCEKLIEFGFDWHPIKVVTIDDESYRAEKNSKAHSKQSGYISCSFLILLFAVLFFSVVAHALENSRAPSEVIIPPPIILPSTGNWLPSVNQFILYPLQGQLYVSYTGVFSNTFLAKGTRLQLPLPKNIEDLHILDAQNVTLMPETHSVILDFPLQPGFNQIKANFILDASSGVAHWQANQLKILPGVTIFVMSEYSGILRDIFSFVKNDVNFWPARIVDVPSDFNSIISADPFVAKQTDRFDPSLLSRQLIRQSVVLSPYPDFRVVGISPQRGYAIILILFFVGIFLTAVGFFYFKKN